MKPSGMIYMLGAWRKCLMAPQEDPAKDAELERLRQMNELKTRFLNMAAHELNTPMTPIRLQVHLLKAGVLGELNPRQRQAVLTLDRNVERLESLVKEVLDVARLEGGHMRISTSSVELDPVVQEVIESFSEVAHQVGVALTGPGRTGITVAADRNRLVQVFYNLVSNAIKFTPEGGTVAVACRAEGDQATVEVTDTGAGLSQEQIGRLFRPFSQVHDPARFTTSGTGLGLFIALGLVQLMGGTIGVTSGGPERGSTFWFTLPLAGAGVAPAVQVPGPDSIVSRLRELI
jgi:signal transduction histidine kinase